MKRLGWMALALAGLLGACESHNSYLEPSKALDKMSPEELCDFYAHYRDNPDLSPHAKDVATNQMRAKHCPTG